MREGGATPPLSRCRAETARWLPMMARGRAPPRGWWTRVRRLRTLRTLRVCDHRLRSVAVRCNRHNRRSAGLISRPVMRYGAGAGRCSATRFRSSTAIWAANLSGWTCPSGETGSVITARRCPRATDAIHVAGRTGDRLVRREAIVVCRGMRCIRGSAVGAAGVRGRAGG